MTKPKSWSDFHRLRKYRRKKFKTSDPKALLYWRYHFKVHGPHQLLWEMET